ncbi:hypothetical protein AB0K27_13910, partial [Micromonospora echinospora]
IGGVTPRERAAGNRRAIPDSTRIRKTTVGEPLSKLTRIAPDVAEAWRRGDDETVDALAALELRGLGLRGR